MGERQPHPNLPHQGGGFEGLLRHRGKARHRLAQIVGDVAGDDLLLLLEEVVGAGYDAIVDGQARCLEIFSASLATAGSLTRSSLSP